MGRIMTEDGKFYKEMLDVHESLVNRGWKKETGKIQKNITDAYYTKDKLGIYIMFGCDEDIKKEI